MTVNQSHFIVKNDKKKVTQTVQFRKIISEKKTIVYENDYIKIFLFNYLK